MKVIPYRYFYNSQAVGFSDGLGFFRKPHSGATIFLPGLTGFMTGDELTLAYDSYIEVEEELPCERLFRIFNAPWERPIEYAGPSMSVGDVVVLYPGTEREQAYGVRTVGFAPVDVSKSAVKEQPKRWVRPPEQFKAYLEAKKADGFELTEDEERIVYGEWRTA